jgi:hypothetical protein
VPVLSDETPAYLKAFGKIDKPLKGFDEGDTAEGFKKQQKAKESVDAQVAKIVRPMPESQMNDLGGRGRDPDWILKGEPRAVQQEALRRSWGGFWLREGQHDTNERGYRLRDGSGFGRTGPARGWAHFMEQRLGKTPVFLNECGLLRRDYDGRFAVVLAPNQFKPEWADEADRFGLDAPTHVFNSNDRKAAQRWVDRNRKFGGLLSVNYEACLSKETLAFLEDLAGPQSILGLDECVSVKNPNGVLSDNVLQLAKLFGWTRDMTGKPVVQGPHDLWMQLRMIGELNGVNYFNYRNRYCKMGGFQGKIVKGIKEEKAGELHEILTACSFMARRVDWLTTPGREYAVQKIEMIREQKVHYERMEKDFLTEIVQTFIDHKGESYEDVLVIAAEQIIGKLLKLQQIASGFIIDEVGKPHDIMPPRSNPKLQHVKNMLSTQLTDKVIIFAHYRHSIGLLMEELKEFQPALIAGDGQMKHFERDVQAEKRRFNGDRGCRVVIGQEQAIRYGHTLMGSPDDPCLSEIFYENNYSLNDRSQCEERPQGEGQKGMLTIYDLQCAPIEGATIEALQRKEDVSAATMNYARDTGVLPREAP